MDQERESAGMEAAQAVPHLHEVEDHGVEIALETQAVHRPGWQVFLPTLVIGVLYLLAWLWLSATGRAGGGLAKLVLLVLAIGVPLLAAHAMLRFQTIRLQARETALLYHPGWPRDMPVELPYALVERVALRRGLAGLAFGGGTLVAELTTGGRTAIADLGNPAAALGDVERRLAAWRSRRMLGGEVTGQESGPEA
jgi:membrane protein YdbS with pleckstrin-like domain